MYTLQTDKRWGDVCVSVCVCVCVVSRYTCTTDMYTQSRSSHRNSLDKVFLIILSVGNLPVLGQRSQVLAGGHPGETPRSPPNASTEGGRGH